MKKVLTLILLMAAGLAAYAQQQSVKGKVVDASGEPVVGLMVLEKGTTNGALTDADGSYRINVKPGALLEFSSLGYKTETVKADRAVIDVTVQDDALMLDAVVAIGYGTARRRDLTTAVSTVSTDDVKIRPVTEVSGLIQGKVAGVTVQQPSGMPGSGLTVRVRGTSSLTSSNDPLYVVDGVPVGEGSYSIAYLSPQDIESMQILKDASSAAIYGSRAANGVVLITTRQGKKSKGPQISFNAYAGFTNVARTYEVLNLEEYKELLVDEGYGSIVESMPADLKDETDWFSEIYRTGVTQNYQVSVSNGNDKMRYYLGGGYSDETGIISSARANRYNVKASFESDLFKWITVGGNIAYSSYRSQGGIISSTGANRAGVVLSIINTPTYAKVWSDENPDWYYTNFYGLSGLTTPSDNVARNKDNFTQTDRLLLTGYAQINFTKNLNFKSTVSMDRRWVHSYSFLDPIHVTYGREQHGSVSDARSDDRRMIYDNILTYNACFDAKHNLEVMAGTSATTSDWQELSASRSYLDDQHDNAIFGLNAGNKGGVRGQSQGWSQWAIMSYLARASYNYDSRYYITANFRADGSSKLAPGHKWGYFPSVSAAWRLSGEDWLKDVSWIDDLKVRAGWGQQGNQAGLGDYAWVQTYNTNYYDWTDSDYATAVPTLGSESNMGNVDLTWETTSQANLGIDFSILGGRLDFTFDAYYKYTKNLLMDVPLPSTATASSLTRNEGEMSNWGLEFAVSSQNIRTADFQWSTDFNISMNRNKLEKLSLQQVYYYAKTSESQNETIVKMEPGQPLSSFYGYIADGVDPETGMMIYRDINGDGRITPSDKTWIGCASPKFTWGMTNTLSYKGFNLSILMTSSIGNDIYNASAIEMMGMTSGYNQVRDVVKRWRVPGNVTDIPKANESYNIKASTRFIEDGSYLKIKNISLSYDISGKWLQKAHISKIQPYVTLDNMITFTGYSGYDPEMSYSSDARICGIDWGTYPCVKTVIFGVNVDF